jgi:hypothetical protein
MDSPYHCWTLKANAKLLQIFLAIPKRLGYIVSVMKMSKQIRGYFAEIGRTGGKATSEAKANAARENAKKGGWPKGKPRKPKQ